jgi:hypothetical protein
MVDSPTRSQILAGIPGGMANADPTVPSKSPNPKDIIGLTKPPVHLVPPILEVEAAMAFLDGAKKYGAYNWREHPVLYSVYHAACKRHLGQAWDGENIDAKSKVKHLAHAVACIAILLDAEACGCLIDDRPTPGGVSKRIEDLTTSPNT